ncbi:alternate-type signal peptide domain-containing protein [Homoserinimonas sp. A447]
MNKLVKGSIAGAAGIALLLGGAGTLAYWNDSATLASAGTVTAGQLDISVEEAGEWTAAYAGGAETTLNAAALAAYRIVPGDKLVYTETLTITAVGDNLSFQLAENVTDTVTSTITGATVASTFDVEGSDGVAVTDFTDLGADTYTVVATITVDFPFDASGATSQAGSTPLDLSGAIITITQIP